MATTQTGAHSGDTKQPLDYLAFREGARKAIEGFDSWVQEHPMQGRADHLCYKCGTNEEYQALRTMLQGASEFLYESKIPRDGSGRPISIIRLLHPFPTRLGEISDIELAAPKPNEVGKARGKFDHIEFYPTAEGDTALDLSLHLEELGMEFTRSGNDHHPTYDSFIASGLKIRIENGPLVETVIIREMQRKK